MSTLEQVDHAVELLGKEDLVIMHATSTYPALYEGIEFTCYSHVGNSVCCSGGIFRPRNRAFDFHSECGVGCLCSGTPYHAQICAMWGI